MKRGRTSTARHEILEGLNAGEAVVVKGSFSLKSQMLKAPSRMTSVRLREQC